MAEIYKELARYRAHVHHLKSEQVIDLRAVVSENMENGTIQINYSHTFRSEGAGDFYYSNSYTSADNLEQAEFNVKSWAEMMAKSEEVGEWSTI